MCSRFRDSRTHFVATGSLQEDVLLSQPGEIRFKIQKILYIIWKKTFVAPFAFKHHSDFKCEKRGSRKVAVPEWKRI